MLRIALFALLVAAVACGDDEPDTTTATTETGGDTTGEPEPEPDPVPGNTITGVVTYSGTAEGNLVFGLYTMLPPMGPPVGFTSVTDPEYPAEFTLDDVEPGMYQLLTVLDIGGDNPTMPGPEDIQIESEMFEVTAELGAYLEVEIVDP